MNSDDSSNEGDMDMIEKNLDGKFIPQFVSGWENDDDGVEEESNPQETPEKEILWAAENGNVERVLELLTKDRTLTKVIDKDGYTSLHRAAYGNHIDVLKILLEYGSDCNAETLDKWTPLHSACQWNSVKCAEKLISLDINVNAQSEGGLTPLHLAATNKESIEIIQALLMHPDIDTSIKNNTGETAFDIALRHGRLGRMFEVTEPCFNFI